MVLRRVFSWGVCSSEAGLGRGKTLTIDFHSHLRLKSLIAALRGAGLSRVSQNKDLESLKEGHLTWLNVPAAFANGEDGVVARLADMKSSGVDLEVLSVPRSHDYPVPIGIRLCKLINDDYDRIIKDHSDRFAALASLPLNDVKESMNELQRSINDIELHGIALGGHMNGVPLDDEIFWDLYEKMNDLELPVFVHPGSPPWRQQGMEEYHLGPSLGYQFDTALAVVRVMYSGLIDQFPKIKFVFTHFGGGVPFLLHRITYGMIDGPAKGIKARKKPSDYVRMVYFDTASDDLETWRYMRSDVPMKLRGPIESCSGRITHGTMRNSDALYWSQ
jgi:aminocarboxymuconate-semialdehyde decarboxylase